LNVHIRRGTGPVCAAAQARWFEGLPSPHRNPQGIDITIFRENTEDIYIGIEYQAGTPENRHWMEGFKLNQPADYAKLPNPEDCGIGIKPVSKRGSQRLVKAALRWELEIHKHRLTLAHKGTS
jgi:isocitrate dehydrogenase